jgi:hypothetical protein
MKCSATVAAAMLLAAVLCSPAAAAELAGQWTTEFKLDEIEVDGDRVSCVVVRDAAWDEEVQANGDQSFRNTAAGTLTDSTLTISGARERTCERAYRADLQRIEPRP